MPSSRSLTLALLGSLLAVCLTVLPVPAHEARAADAARAAAEQPAEQATPSASDAEAGSDLAPTAPDVYRLPSVTVTADKRLTEVQKTPIAVSVISGQELEDKNIKTVRDVLAEVPNVYSSNWMGGMNWMSFRGATSVTATDTSPLIMYVDGVPVDTFYNLDATLMDIERVEILRGPQSAIYGKNALGGVINIISKKPDNTWRGKIFGFAETHDGWGGGAMVSGPLKQDMLFFSLAASHDHKGGWMKNDNSSDSNYERDERLKGQLRFTPSDRAEFTLHADYTATRDGFTAYALNNHYSNKSPASDHDKQKTDIMNLALKAKLDFDPMTFESITTYRYENFDYRMSGEPWSFLPTGDPTGATMAGRDSNRREVTQELRLRSPDGTQGFTWLAGMYASYADYHISKMFQDYKYFYFPGLAEGSHMDFPFRQYTTEFAPFAQVVVPVTDAFKVTAGLRWHYTHRSARFNINPDAALVAASAMMGMPMTPMRFSADKDWNELLPKLNLSYDITDDHMVYAGVSRSFAPGGFNYGTMTDKNYTYDSQTAWNYEVGAKTSWLDKRLNVNAALFYSSFDDLQVMQYNAATAAYLARNAGSASSCGAELDVMARLAKGLDAQVTLGYTHARYDDYKNGGTTGTGIYDDNKIQLTPEYTINASLKYRHDNGLFAMGAVRYISKIYWEASNIDYREPVTTVDARLGYEGEHFDAYVYGKNIFGERYVSFYTPISNLSMMAPPQTFGFEIAYKF